ncbi:hypothetical protein K431DRAFT_289290 [Polychaeton citri CBS 116435]|uniref:Uncharacterized protein n=1 Tax=Polychaeton citri CBS 116435 TaxID=1314669 RepID=A0A9P4PZB4_9PEZI|nr:hypothetical protein K431DRAFT_289290 [Polychaeton citri CBS 116435]
MEERELSRTLRKSNSPLDHSPINELTNSSPARARTDPTHVSPTKSSSRQHGHSVTRRLHANSLLGRDRERHHHHYSVRHSAKDHVQSAVEIKPPVSFENFLRRERKRGGTESTDASRRGSGPKGGNGTGLDGASESQLSSQEAIERERRKRAHVTEAHVAIERARNEKRQEELRDRLKSLDELGMQSMRQLDDTYYMILEKASSLRSTVASLQKLADQGMRMHKTFEEETSTLEKGTRGSAEGWEGFSEQQRIVNELVMKLQDNKAQTEKLNGRLHVARKRVEAYDDRQRRQHVRSQNRWRMIWFALATLVIFMLSLLIARHRKSVGKVIDDFGLGYLPAAAHSRPRQAAEEDAYLRKLFDDL